MRRFVRRAVVSSFFAVLFVEAAAAPPKASVARGAYLVASMSCGDCHTPRMPTSNGSAPDRTRGLSGHPESLALPPPPAPQGPWLWGGAATNTAFWGPWGVSYAINLTPDATGLASWKPDDFVKAMRSGKHLGTGRPILPPMPWTGLGKLSDSDLHAMFAYLVAQPPIRNQVPAPTPAAAR